MLVAYPSSAGAVIVAGVVSDGRLSPSSAHNAPRLASAISEMAPAKLVKRLQ